MRDDTILVLTSDGWVETSLTQWDFLRPEYLQYLLDEGFIAYKENR